MAHQVLDRHRPFGRDQLQRRLAVGTRLLLADFDVLEGRDVLGDRIGERQLALLEQHHRRHRGDRLGHGIDAEDRILGHRRLLLGVEAAHGLEVGDLAVPRDEQDGAGDRALGDVGLERVGDRLQALGGSPTLSGGVVGSGSATRRARRGAGRATGRTVRAVIFMGVSPHDLVALQPKLPVGAGAKSNPRRLRPWRSAGADARSP